MENYQRRKLYRIHLKNISQIKNCKSPKNTNAYSSRLYNLDLGIFSQKMSRKVTKDKSPKKKMLTNVKRLEENYLVNFQREKQNFRLSTRLLNVCGSINMDKYEKQYEEHRKIMKMHRKIKAKRIIMYRFHDIKFKGLTPDLTQIFSIYDMKPQKQLKFLQKKSRCIKTPLINKAKHERVYLKSNDGDNSDIQILDSSSKKQKKFSKTQTNQFTFQSEVPHKFFSQQNSIHDSSLDLLMRGNIFQLRKSMIQGYKDEKIKLKVVGRMTGQICLQQMEMIPIMHNKEIIGSVIVEIC